MKVKRPNGLSMGMGASSRRLCCAAEDALVRFGVISDVQYADIDDGWDYLHLNRRFYRNALTLLHQNLKVWETKKVDFAVNLGDLIDGKHREAFGHSKAALAALQHVFGAFEKTTRAKVYHLLGNHDLYALPQKTLEQELLFNHLQAPSHADNHHHHHHHHHDNNNNTNNDHQQDQADHTATIPHGQRVKPQHRSLYYDFSMEKAPHVRFVVLNSYGFSVLDNDEQARKKALAFLRKRNPNDNLNSPLGLHGLDQRFVAYNAGVEPKQLAFLRKTLAKAQQQSEKVVIFTHIPIHPETCHPSCLLWNYQAVLDVVFEYDQVVRAVFGGHTHQCGYAVQRNVHFVVFSALLECDPTQNAHAIVTIHRDSMQIHGFGKIASRTIPLWSGEEKRELLAELVQDHQDHAVAKPAATSAKIKL